MHAWVCTCSSYVYSFAPSFNFSLNFSFNFSSNISFVTLFRPVELLVILFVILFILGEIEALLEPPFYILQRFKLQLDESITQKIAEDAALLALVSVCVCVCE
jgi:hypothetical protein